MLTEILFISFVAALVNLDSMIWLVMISRPIIVAPLIGYIAGDLMVGLRIGVLLELIWLNVLPLGAAIPSDTSAASALAPALATLPLRNLSEHMQDDLIMLAILCAILLGIIFKRFNIFLCKFNIKLAHMADNYAQEGSISKIEYMNRIGILLVFLKNLIFYFLSIITGITIVSWLAIILHPIILKGLEISLSLMPVLGFAVALTTFSERRIWKLPYYE